MKDQPNKPLLSDEQVVRLEDLNGSKMTPFEVRDIYEAERAKDRELVQALVNACAELNEGWEQMIAGYGYDPGNEPKDSKNQIARAALQLAAENGYAPSAE